MTAKTKNQFIKKIISGYTPSSPFMILGAGVVGGETCSDAQIKIPLKTLNRHGLIAGATGTGKTKSLQIMAEQLSLAGVPSLVMDMKGDLSGLGAPGEEKDFITKRHADIGLPYEPVFFPVEMLSLSSNKGIQLRATVTEFGPLLMARILGLNETQESILSVLFQFCDENGLLLLDLKDLKAAISYMSNEGKSEFEKNYGKVSTSSSGTILRKVVALEGQGAKKFFGERSFEIEDLQRLDENGHGFISILRLQDIQDKPALFSTFMLQLLAEIYSTMPEEGDLDKPKMVIFIDEAHLIFKTASKALLEQIEMIVKLIRSKGVGIFFVTQNPNDIPDAVLSQLGLKVQHALRAFTAKDRKAIKQAAQNFPVSPFYETDILLTEMGIGEAMVTGLSEKGRPTPLAWTMMRAPQSRMGTLKPAELKLLLEESTRIGYYNEKIDRDSAYEILQNKAEGMNDEESESTDKGNKEATHPVKKSTSRSKKEESTVEKIMDSTLARQVGRTVARELTRGLMGVLGIKKSRRRSGGWF